jgi:pimeloyl-ACP methyl ester carboxylesterase
MAQVTVHNAEINSYGIKLAYRLFGPSHHRSLGSFLVQNFAEKRPLILFDNAGISHSSEPIGDNMAAMAAHVLEILALLNVKQVSILGFRLGGVVARFVELNGPPGLV